MKYYLHLSFTDVLEIQLRIFCGDSYAEIAQDFALTENEVKKAARLLRNVINLRKWIHQNNQIQPFPRRMPRAGERTIPREPPKLALLASGNPYRAEVPFPCTPISLA